MLQTQMPMLRPCTWSSVPTGHLYSLPLSLFSPSLALPLSRFLSIFLSPGPKESSLTSPRVNANTRPCTTGGKSLAGAACGLISSALLSIRALPRGGPRLSRRSRGRLCLLSAGPLWIFSLTGVGGQPWKSRGLDTSTGHVNVCCRSRTDLACSSKLCKC